MAVKLQCEICGGKLIGKPGGIFECDSCGTEYSTEWAKAKIQEIQGTVKVEGTVEVQGTVKVEGAVNKESLLKRGYMALEDGKWEDAKEYFDQALNADAECADAYLGLAYASMHFSSAAVVEKIDDRKVYNALLENTSFKKHMRFADDAQKRVVTALLECVEKNCVERERKRDELVRERDKLYTEISEWKVIFSGKRRKQIEMRLSEIDAELKKLS